MVLLQQKSHRIRDQLGRDSNSLDDIVSLINQFTIGEVSVDGLLRESDTSSGPTSIEVTAKTQVLSTQQSNYRTRRFEFLTPDSVTAAFIISVLSEGIERDHWGIWISGGIQ